MSEYDHPWIRRQPGPSLQMSKLPPPGAPEPSAPASGVPLEPTAPDAPTDRLQPIIEAERDRVAPIALNEQQERAVQSWAADDRLWATQETVKFNLRIFARVILSSTPDAPTEPWQPIETAPKDGQWIAVTSTHNQYCRGMVQYVSGVWLDWHDQVIRNLHLKATHWMPIPTTPKDTP